MKKTGRKSFVEESELAKYSQRAGNGKRTALIVLCVLLAVILLVLVMATAALEMTWGKINRFSDQEQTLSQAEKDALLGESGDLDVSWGTISGDKIGAQEDVVNILLIGQDRREGESRSRSDAMILCTFNKKNNTVTFTSFLRDLYVQIPGYSDNRLNVAYPLEGMSLLDETLEVNFGIHVDANVEVDFTEFQQVVDAVGGVDIYLTAEEAEHLTLTYGFTDLYEGMNHLDGERALAYSRIRVLDSDFGRTNRQRTVLSAMFDSCRDLSLGGLLSLAGEVFPMVTTDMSNGEIIRYATDLFPMLANATVQTQSVPGDGMYYDTYIDDMAVLVPDLGAISEMLKETLLGQ